MDKETAKKVGAKNDELRRQIYFPPEGDRVILSPSVKCNPDPVLQAVRDFDPSESRIDTGGENDFGVVVVESQEYYFQINYYNADLSGRGNPLDESTRRVLSIMKADEYDSFERKRRENASLSPYFPATRVVRFAWLLLCIHGFFFGAMLLLLWLFR